MTSLPGPDPPSLDRDGAGSGAKRRTGPRTMMVGSSTGSCCRRSDEGRGWSTSGDGATKGEAAAEQGGGGNKKSSCNGEVG
jgi:hypothetical protein